MTQDDIEEIRDMLSDDTRLLALLDTGDWMGYVEELLAEVERLNAIISKLQGGAE